MIIGGLVSTTLLDVLLTPGLFWVFGRRAAERIVRTKGGRNPEVVRMAAVLEDESAKEKAQS